MQQSMTQEDRQRLIESDEEAQVVAAAQKDPAAFALLYDRYASPVYRYLLSRTGSIEESRDLTSQTFLTAYEVFPRYRHRGCFSAWLFSIARSKFIDHVRRKNRSAKTAIEPADGPPEPLAQVIESERLADLRRRIGVLEEDEQELLRLRFAAGLSYGQMAALLNKNEDAVKKSVYRLLARLQSQMEG